MRTRIVHIVGARPNYMKIAPIMQCMAHHSEYLEQFLVHTGQHYDHEMSGAFFDDLSLDAPVTNLGVGSGSHAQQTAQIMARFEPVLLDIRPDWVVVPGDVNSTLACALVASKLGVKVAHVESGLRSFDRTMPEEINRILTDHLSDLLFTTEPSANKNLVSEGIDQSAIHYVGNVMIDSLVRLLPRAEEEWTVLRKRYALERFALITLHRPSNVDNSECLEQLIEALNFIANRIQVVFPIHPRTRKRLQEPEWAGRLSDAIIAIDPLGYLDFLCLEKHATLVITDSGGVQEETTYLGIPCLTLRPNTERPITIEIGTNQLAVTNARVIIDKVLSQLNCPAPTQAGSRPELWDGFAGERIVATFLRQ